MSWKYKTLDELGFVGRGRSRHRPRGDEKLYGGNYPFIQTGDVQKAEFYITEFNQTYSEFGFTQSKLWNKGTLCISIVGANTAESAVLGIDACFPDSVIGFIADRKVSNTAFVKYYLDTIKVQMKTISEGAARENLSMDKLLSLKMFVPNVDLQDKIASILSAYDDLIENNNQRIKLLEEMAEEIYKEWFVRFRFPGYKSAAFIDKEGNNVAHGTKGAIPEEWGKLKLRECLEHYIGGGWGEEFPNAKNTIPAHVIRGTDFPDYNVGKLNFDVLRYHTKSNLSSRICEPNDIIFEVSGGTESQSLGRTCFISRITIKRFKEPVICASFCKLLRVDNSVVSPFYINELLNRMHGTGELKVYQVQSTGISNYQFEDFIEATKINIPPNEVQEKFDNIIASMYDEIQILGEKNQILQETRDLLLPRLISGKLSVEELEVEENLNMAAEPQTNY